MKAMALIIRTLCELLSPKSCASTTFEHEKRRFPAMAWTQEEMQRLRDRGLISDSIWYQINGKSFEENYQEILRKRNKKYAEIMRQRYAMNLGADTHVHISSEIKLK